MTTPTATIFLPYHALDEVHQRGTRAAQPAASAVVPGTLYFVTDEGVLERSDGSAWAAYAPAGGAGGGAPAAHHATHEPGGTDALVGAAWTTLSNTFVGDQTVDGDLFVTGTVDPVTVDQRDQINQLIGDPTGSRMLMSSSYVSGLSLRHDQDLSLGKIACGNYDAQTYQSLATEVESLQVRTGATPATLAEHLRVHPSGGVTVGEGTDHDTDPGVGVLRARGLDGTPLDATHLTSGTLPDVRLSANVALKNTANTFTQDMTIGGKLTVNASTRSVVNYELEVARTGNPQIMLTDNSQPANGRKFRWTNYSQELWLNALSDDEQTNLSTPLTCHRSGEVFTGSHLHVGGDLYAGAVTYERGRSVPLGEWAAIPFNAADFTADGGTWTVNNVNGNVYSLIGTTLLWNAWFATTLSAQTSNLYIRLPAGLQTVPLTAFFPVPYFSYGGAEYGAQAYPNDATHILIRKSNPGGPIPAGGLGLAFSIVMRIT